MKKILFCLAIVLALAKPGYCAAISSNGTGGGSWSATATWSGAAVPTTNDVVTIVAGDTVTIDDSASATIILGADGGAGTDALIINGTLQYLHTAGVDHTLQCRGDIEINSGGTLSIGTSSNPIPSTRTFTLALNDDGADGDYGLNVRNGGTLILQGAELTYDRCWLAADVAASATTLTTDVETGWKSGDVIAIASTSRTHTECESATLSEDADVDDNDEIKITSGLSYAHDGGATSATKDRAEIIHLTRNVKVTSADAGYAGNVYADTTAILDIDWVELSLLGTDAANKRSIEIDTNNSGSVSFNGCSIHDTEVGGFYLSIASNNAPVSITNTVFYNISTTTTQRAIYAVSNLGTDMTLDNIIIMKVGVGPGSSSYSRGFECGCPDATYTNLTAIGTAAAGFYLTGGNYQGTINNLVAHSCNGIQIDFNVVRGSSNDPVFMSNIKSWRASSANGGLFFNSLVNYITLDTVETFGNATYSLFSTGNGVGVTIKNATVDSDPSYTSAYFFEADAGATIKLINCSFGQTTDYSSALVYAASTVSILSRVTMINCKFAGDSISTLNFDPNAFIASYNHNQVAGRNKVWKKYGLISDQVTGGQAAAWARGGSGTCVYLDPSSTTAGETLGWEFYIPVTASASTTLSFYHKETDEDFNGTLTVTVYDSDDDTTVLLDEESISSFSTDWAQYTSTAFTPSQTGFCRVVVKVLNGSTTADIGIDDVTVSPDINTNLGNNDRWLLGQPANIMTDGTDSGGGGSGSDIFGWIE